MLKSKRAVHRINLKLPIKLVKLQQQTIATHNIGAAFDMASDERLFSDYTCIMYQIERIACKVVEHVVGRE